MAKKILSLHYLSYRTQWYQRKRIRPRRSLMTNTRRRRRKRRAGWSSVIFMRSHTSSSKMPPSPSIVRTTRGWWGLSHVSLTPEKTVSLVPWLLYIINQILLDAWCELLWLSSYLQPIQRLFMLAKQTGSIARLNCSCFLLGILCSEGWTSLMLTSMRLETSLRNVCIKSIQLVLCMLSLKCTVANTN